MPTKEIKVPVLIVGGGPIGLAIAAELGIRNVECLLVNDRLDTSEVPKAGTVSARSLEHLRRYGITEKLRSGGLPKDYPTDVVFCTRFSGTELARLPQPSNAESVRMAQNGKGPWPTPEPPFRGSQIWLERCMRERVQELPAVDLRFGWRLNSFRQEGDKVFAHASEVRTGNIGPKDRFGIPEEIDIQADYMIGADGAGGLVRPQLGIKYEGEGSVTREFLGGTMYFVLFEAKRDPSWLKVDDAWMYWVVNPDVRALMLQVDSTERFILHSAVKPGVELSSLDPDWFLKAAAGVEFPRELLTVNAWTAGLCLVADRYYQDRVFLCGDSTHLFTPAGGNGMNTGLDDAANLAWKLAAVCKGWGGPNLLPTYQQERHAIGVRNTSAARDLARWIGNIKISNEVEADTPAGREERAKLGPELEAFLRTEYIVPGLQFGVRYDESPLVTYDNGVRPPDEPNSYTAVGCPGIRAPHFWMKDGSSLYDHFGPEFTLMKLGGTKTDTSAIQSEAGKHGVPLKVIDVPGDEPRDAYERDLVLVRPDQHVAWRGNALPPDSLALIDTVRGA